MAGLTAEGFTPKTLEEIQNSIESKLEVLSPGFDFSPESPDGQMINIMSLELAQAWNELYTVYHSYNPNQAIGAGLRNLGLITGIAYGAATRSQAIVGLVGTTGVTVPAGSVVIDGNNNEFVTQYTAVIPANVQVVATLSGPIEVPAGSLVTPKTIITGWDSCTQALDGTTGATAQTAQQFRTLRNRTVLRNYKGTPDVMQARLYEAGLTQVNVKQNTDAVSSLPDGTPPNQVHVIISPVATVSDADVARIILNTKPAGVSTYGSTSVVLDDTQGNSHTIKFTKATAKNIYVNLDVTFLDADIAGAQEAIIADVVSSINNLQVGERVIISRLYSSVTPYGKAQVNTLEIGFTDGGEGTSNLTIGDNEFAFCADSLIDFTVT